MFLLVLRMNKNTFLDEYNKSHWCPDAQAPGPDSNNLHIHPGKTLRSQFLNSTLIHLTKVFCVNNTESPLSSPSASTLFSIQVVSEKFNFTTTFD